MMILEKIARRITPTRFGRWAMNTDGELTLLKARWGVRTCVGIAMILLSFIVGVPGVVVCGFLARKFHEPVILALGGSAAMALNYALFGVGIYLAGGNYASFLLRRCVRKFIRRFSG